MKKSASYLNNDGIDQLTPALRATRVSSLSISDMAQWQNHPLVPRNTSILDLSRNHLFVVREPKAVIDHTRVALYAFAFDIDGVIVRGPETIPEAREAIRMLNGENKYNIKVPYIFVTNGGGKLELLRSEDLSKRLGTEVKIDQIIQGHTPMRDLVDVYKHVLVVGGLGDTCRKVAKEYGFKHVYTPLDVMKWNPSVTPYHDLTPEELAVARDVDFSKVSIDAILVFADSRNWAADQQIILELLMSKKGVMGTVSTTFDEGPGIYFAHSDFVWATNYGLSRYGMGALQVSIAAIYREHTGRELVPTRFGKPQRGTFKFASKVLGQWREKELERHVLEMNLQDKAAAEEQIAKEEGVQPVKSDSDLDSEDDDAPLDLSKLNQVQLDLPPALTVYFVGDTPESDIRFANLHDVLWFSILVQTGVYKPGTTPTYKPKHVCTNVLEAVKFAIEREHQKELEEWNAHATPGPSGLSSAIASGPLTPAQEEVVELGAPVVDLEDAGEEVDLPAGLADAISKVKHVQ